MPGNGQGQKGGAYIPLNKGAASWAWAPGPIGRQAPAAPRVSRSDCSKWAVPKAGGAIFAGAPIASRGGGGAFLPPPKPCLSLGTHSSGWGNFAPGASPEATSLHCRSESLELWSCKPNWEETVRTAVGSGCWSDSSREAHSSQSPRATAASLRTSRSLRTLVHPKDLGICGRRTPQRLAALAPGIWSPPTSPASVREPRREVQQLAVLGGTGRKRLPQGVPEPGSEIQSWA